MPAQSQPQRSSASPPAVQVDAKGVQSWEAGALTRIEWKDLAQAWILTNDKGPVEEDMWWFLRSEDGSTLKIPDEDPAFISVMDHVFTLQGHDANAVSIATCCSENASFLVWERKAP